jgi:transposase-like protein
MIMPGVDFDVLRREVTMQQVLNELGFQAIHCDDDQLRGPCPVHGSSSKHSRVFSVNLSEGRYYCHKCKSHGNQLELYAVARNTTVYQAAVDLCRALGRDVPWIKRW